MLYGLIIIFLFWLSYLPRVLWRWVGQSTPCDPKMCMHFSVWTEVKWTSGWCYALMDEGLRGFGLLESAKTMDSWSSWSFEGASIFLLCVFYFLMLFIVCRWWVLFCSLHEMGGIQHWSTWSFVLPLDMMCNGGQLMASIRWSFQFYEAKFFC